MAGDVRHGPGTNRPGEPYGEPTGSGSGGRYDDHEQRLRRLEELMVRIDTRMEQVASREFIYKTILTGIGLAVGLAATITALIFRFWPASGPGG